MIARCSHPTCRTSLDDESVVYCGHDVKFCEYCDWGDGCDDCHLEQMTVTNQAIWDAAGDSRPTPPTAADEWAGHWGEQARDERALPHADPRMDDRAADNYYEKRWGA